jgi:hypothetical protein
VRPNWRLNDGVDSPALADGLAVWAELGRFTGLTFLGGGSWARGGFSSENVMGRLPAGRENRLFRSPVQIPVMKPE